MNYDKIIELDNVTVQDCCELYEYKGLTTVINNGRVSTFEKEEVGNGRYNNVR